MYTESNLCDMTIRWCTKCQVPLGADTCDVCGNKGRELASDLKPVFHIEHDLLEEIFKSRKSTKSLSAYGRIGNRFLPTPLFRNGNTVYYRGRKLFTYSLDISSLRFKLKKAHVEFPKRYSASPVDWTRDSSFKSRLVDANRSHLSAIESEARRFIRDILNSYHDKEFDRIVSFSGGKDSAVVASLVLKEANAKLVFIDTGIEYDETVQYIKDFIHEMNVPQSRFYWATTSNDFFELCKTIGIPSRTMRWCCSTQKSSAANSFFNSVGNKVISFDGIRRSESRLRSEYPRVKDNTKISKQVSAYPILDWRTFDVWLYTMFAELPINPIYMWGYSRVGCWPCPNPGKLATMLLSKSHPELHNRLYSILFKYAREHGRDESWVTDGHWKNRRSHISYRVKVEQHQLCSDGFETANMFLDGIPESAETFLGVFGTVKKIGNIVTINGDGINLTYCSGGETVNISIDKEHERAKMMRRVIKKQLEKVLNCENCGGCIASCQSGALYMSEGVLRLAQDKCTHCLVCTTTKFVKQSCVAIHYKESRNIVRDLTGESIDMP